MGVVKQKTVELKKDLALIFDDIVKGKGIVIKKAKIFEERTKEVKKTEKTDTAKEEKKEEKKDTQKKFDFDSLMVDDLDDLF